MNCPTNKIKYGSRAEVIAATRRSGSGAKVQGNQPYRCVCGFWHLGRPLPKHAKRKLRRYLEGRFEDERRTR